MSALPRDTVWVPPTLDRYPDPYAVQFLTQRQVVEAARHAHLIAQLQIRPPRGQRWACAGDLLAYAGPENLYEAVLREFDGRLRRVAYERGHLIADLSGGAP